MQGQGGSADVDYVDDALSILFDLFFVGIPVIGVGLIIWAAYDIIVNDILKKKRK